MNITSLKKWMHKYPGDVPQLFLIGGTVRDMLLNVPPKDIDLTCRGARDFAYNLAAICNAAIVPMEKKPQTPCYRVVDREDINNYLDIAEIRGETIYDDLQQRDFTIKAVRQDSFASDPLRIIRAFRFSATLNFDIEDLTLDHIRKNVELLMLVSGERIFSELLLILGTTNSTQFIKQMDQFGILEALFPEIRAMKGCSQNAFHHKDVWEHSLLVMENCEEDLNKLPALFEELSDEITANLSRDHRFAVTKLAALLHDIGKPACREIVPDTGRITFHGHGEKGAGLMDEIAERLKMSSRDKEFLKLLVSEHLHLRNLAKHGVKPATKMRWFRKMKDDVIPSIIVGMADVKSSLGPDSSVQDRDNFLQWSHETIKNYYETIKKRLERRDLITGRDLVTLGMEPGPEMGRILEQIQIGRAS